MFEFIPKEVIILFNTEGDYIKAIDKVFNTVDDALKYAEKKGIISYVINTYTII